MLSLSLPPGARGGAAPRAWALSGWGIVGAVPAAPAGEPLFRIETSTSWTHGARPGAAVGRLPVMGEERGDEDNAAVAVVKAASVF
ncbi:hypothetical protein MNEG_13887 [Monoraphidium neglectum]|jgi:hypothetical protein|uniref:Uncharacterized protein n=1 Tax=Monoraphidium neglectum TaxID=145388 RepID=A0A0D2LQV0_9CHLO|nr:hypothetical protein MNEG_13887 [Monoraphidium neglectum]KIY94074.1 hypothetical protein MNEG_13887 [Monoraphidium neglectum]|eukprot:XP_013893094.1 hypothetical protein MNEG_13887 [Monoraphidium neglectum]